MVALSGDLGAGKTAFVKGVAKGLGIKENVNSPTFVIAKEYKINLKFKIKNLKLVHIDAYRLHSYKDAKAIGLEEYFNKDNICLVEWPENISQILPKNTKYIKLEHLGENKRGINVFTN